jgi:hypothetical protein
MIQPNALFAIVDNPELVTSAEIEETFAVDELLSHWFVMQKLLLGKLGVDPVSLRCDKRA